MLSSEPVVSQQSEVHTHVTPMHRGETPFFSPPVQRLEELAAPQKEMMLQEDNHMTRNSARKFRIHFGSWRKRQSSCVYACFGFHAGQSSQVAAEAASKPDTLQLQGSKHSCDGILDHSMLTSCVTDGFVSNGSDSQLCARQPSLDAYTRERKQAFPTHQNFCLSSQGMDPNIFTY